MTGLYERRSCMAHPLSSDESSTTRRARIGADIQRSTTNYFDLKRESDARIAATGTASNAFTNGEQGTTAPAAHPSNAMTLLCRMPSVPENLKAISDRDESSDLEPPPKAGQVDPRQSSTPLDANEIVKTSWHALDDPSINSLLATSAALRDALRVLSRALQDINARHTELQAMRKRENSAGRRAKQRAKQIMWGLDDEQKAVARTVIDAVFTEDAEQVLAVALDDGVNPVSSNAPITP